MAVNFLAHIHRRSQTAPREALRDAFRCIEALMHVRIDIPYTTVCEISNECEISNGYKHATIDVCHIRHQNYGCDSYVKHACTYLLLNSREWGCVSASSLQHCERVGRVKARGIHDKSEQVTWRLLFGWTNVPPCQICLLGGITRVPGVPSQRPKAEKRYQQLYYRTNAAAVHERSTAGVLQKANAAVNVCR